MLNICDYLTQFCLLIATLWFSVIRGRSAIPLKSRLRSINYTPMLITAGTHPHDFVWRGSFPFYRIYYPPYRVADTDPLIRACVVIIDHHHYIKLHKFDQQQPLAVDEEEFAAPPLPSPSNFGNVLCVSVKDAYGDYQDITKIFMLLTGPKHDFWGKTYTWGELLPYISEIEGIDLVVSQPLDIITNDANLYRFNVGDYITIPDMTKN